MGMAEARDGLAGLIAVIARLRVRRVRPQAHHAERQVGTDKTIAAPKRAGARVDKVKDAGCDSLHDAAVSLDCDD